MGKGRIIASGHQLFADFCDFQLDNAILEGNMLDWLQPGKVNGSGRVLVGGYENGCRNGSDPVPCPPGITYM